MKKIKFIAMLFIATLVFVSCQNEDTLDNEAVSADKYPAITAKLQKMHFNPSDLKAVEIDLPDGTIESGFQFEEDIVMTEEQIMNMKMGGDITTKQYRTNNLVSTPWWGGTRTLTIIGYTGANSSGLSSKERTALSWAVWNYNSLNLRIRFSLSYGTNWWTKDMVVYRSNIGFVGGKAGFPSGGKPYKYIRINGLSPYSYNVNEHVITHEMGHAVGFRHTDWYRRKCGGGNEGVGSIGAVHIPGTPWSIDYNSIMISCFSSTEDGEFDNYDKIALRYMY